MLVTAEIEIAASPEECRKVFFDWSNWNDDVIKSIARIPLTKTGPVEKGEKLSVNMSGMTVEMIVQETTPEEFTWKWEKFLVNSGIHSYHFKPSTITPGSTRFVNSEEFLRLSSVVMRLMPVQKMFAKFCEEFKARVEASQSSGEGEGQPK